MRPSSSPAGPSAVGVPASRPSWPKTGAATAFSPGEAEAADLPQDAARPGGGGAAAGADDAFRARPGGRVVQVVGGGAFHRASPDAVHAVAQQDRPPIPTVALGKRGRRAMKMAVLRAYPDGAAKAADEFHARPGPATVPRARSAASRRSPAPPAGLARR